ncbi:MAG: GNAT family N-acetyltransferase [Nitrososphaerales archaeon]
MKVSIRRARKSDSRSFIDLVISLAKFEHLASPTSSGKRRLVQDTFEKKRLRLFLSFVDKKPVGYTLYFFTYSSFLARPTLYLEDLFVLEQFRGMGVGTKLFERCAEEARKLDCGRMEWSVLTWNQKAIGFYEKIGAKRLKEWHYYRLDRKGIELNSKGNTGP